MCETILLIDDDAAIRDLISDLLTEAGYAIQVAADGHEALTYLHATDRIASPKMTP